MGVIFYTLGEFPTREEYLYFVESQDTSNSSFAAARQYSQIAKRIYDQKIKDNPDIMKTIRDKRAEIRSRNTGVDDNTAGSLEEAKFWFENMTYFQVHFYFVLLFGLEKPYLLKHHYHKI